MPEFFSNLAEAKSLRRQLLAQIEASRTELAIEGPTTPIRLAQAAIEDSGYLFKRIRDYLAWDTYLRLATISLARAAKADRRARFGAARGQLSLPGFEHIPPVIHVLAEHRKKVAIATAQATLPQLDAYAELRAGDRARQAQSEDALDLELAAIRELMRPYSEAIPGLTVEMALAMRSAEATATATAPVPGD